MLTEPPISSPKSDVFVLQHARKCLYYTVAFVGIADREHALLDINDEQRFGHVGQLAFPK